MRYKIGKIIRIKKITYNASCQFSKTKHIYVNTHTYHLTTEMEMPEIKPDRIPGVIPSCAAARSNSSRLIPSGFSPT